MKLHNQQHLKPLRRKLRAHLTPAEVKLWKYLQRGQLQGRKFRRQHSIGPYIVDLYCPRKRLVIELDGAVHADDQSWQHDELRSAFLKKHGLRVIRFENREVMENLEGVLARISQYFLM